MDVKITKPLGGGRVRAIPSKSFAHRLLICSALADFDTYIECGETSDDIDATVECLESLGACIRYDGTGFEVSPVPLALSDEKIMQNCGESGSTLRFMLPVCCALGVPAEFVMRGRLPERPMSPLLEQLASHGCVTSKSAGSLHCRGMLKSGAYELPGNISSQFISGLLFALPLLYGNSVIGVEGRESSMPYINMTLDALGSFGIRIEREYGSYRINGGQQYSTPGTVGVEGDWSNAAFWLCAGAIGAGGVTCTGLNLDSYQGDKDIAQLLERFGADLVYGNDSVTVTPAKLHGIRIDAGDTPDLVPALSIAAAVAEGETVIYNAGRLKIKESDRLTAVMETLRGLGADITVTPDGLKIRGKNALNGGAVASFGDHRIAMMAAIASTVCKNPVTICNAGAVTKSYPGFFRDFESLGGRVVFQ